MEFIIRWRLLANWKSEYAANPLHILRSVRGQSSGRCQIDCSQCQRSVRVRPSVPLRGPDRRIRKAWDRLHQHEFETAGSRKMTPRDIAADQAAGLILEPYYKQIGLKSWPRGPLKHRALFMTQVQDGCWPWLGSLMPNGYGQISEGGTRSRRFLAHRVVYEIFCGPIPEGLFLDHLCKNRKCVNPSHLQPVTAAENILRGSGITAISAKQTHCKNGHEFNSENTYLNPSGSRVCVPCRRVWTERWLKDKPHYYRNRKRARKRTA